MEPTDWEPAQALGTPVLEDAVLGTRLAELVRAQVHLVTCMYELIDASHLRQLEATLILVLATLVRVAHAASCRRHERIR